MEISTESILTSSLAPVLYISIFAAIFPFLSAQAQTGAEVDTVSTSRLLAETVKKTGEHKTEKKKPEAGHCKIEVWELEQKSDLIGPVRCLISSDGVRLNAQKMGLVWVFKAPLWDAYLYNVESRTYCSYKYEVWKERGFFMPSSSMSGGRGHGIDKLKTLKVKKTGNILTIAGCKSTEVVINYQDGTKYGEIWLSSSILAPKQFSEVIGKMVRAPIEEGGTPMRVAIMQRPGTFSQVLDTVAAKKIDVDAKLFEPLKGYRKVKDEMALLFETSENMSGSGNHSLFAAPGSLPASKPHKSRPGTTKP